MKSVRFAALAAALAPALVIAACNGQAAQSPTPNGEPAVSGGKLVLPAVAGNPGVAYFTVKNEGTQPASLAGVSVQGAAKAEMHETEGNSMSPLTIVTLGPGATASFAPGGKHVMLFGVSKSLKPGDTAELTLFFSGGRTITGPLQVEAPGTAP